MYSTDLEIHEENGIYSLWVDGQAVQCLFSNDPVSSSIERLIEHIRDDFDRCGHIGIEDNKIQTNSVNCAYHIFSIQKLKVENEETYKKILSAYAACPKYDYALIQTANGPPLEIEQIARFTPVRNALQEQIGNNNFDELTEFAWGAYYSNSVLSDAECMDYDGPGKLIRDDDFVETDASKAIVKLIDDLTTGDAACLCALHEALGYQSLLLPLALLKGWISKSEYVSGSMVLGGQIADLSGVEGTDKSHQESFNFHNNIAEICLSFSAASEECSSLLAEESIVHEFKASIRTPYPDYPPQTLNANGQSEFCLGNKVFASKKKINEFLENIVLKTVASFLNTRGGRLVIGVHEKDNKKSVVGISREGFKSNDLYERHIIELLKNKFGATLVSRNITTQINNLQGKEVCVIEIEELKGGELAYLDDLVFVRTGPRVDQLSTKEVVELIQSKVKS